MAEYVTYPLNTDAYYDAADAQVYTATREKGVYANDHFNATVTGVDNSVTIAPGLAWAKPDEWSGVAFASKTPVKVDLPLADPSQPRFDLITIQFNSIREFRGEIDYIQGTPSSNPNYPETSRNNNVFELALYAVRRNVGAVTITAADIFDLRIDEQYCGIMRDGVTGIDTSVIVANVDETLAQLTAQGNATIEALDEALQSVLDRNGLMLKSEYADQPNVVNESKVSQDAQVHIANSDNPHAVTKAQVGLSNVADVAALPLAGGKMTGQINFDKDSSQITMWRTGWPNEFMVSAGYGGIGGAEGIHWSPGTHRTYLISNGITAQNAVGAYIPITASDFIEASSQRFKNNIVSMDFLKAKDLILNLKPVKYDLISDGTPRYGFIAEDVEFIDKVNVAYDENEQPDGLHYSGFIAPMVALLQDQQKHIDDLTARVQALEAEREA